MSANATKKPVTATIKPAAPIPVPTPAPIDISSLTIEQLQEALQAKKDGVVPQLRATADELMRQLKEVIAQLRNYGESVNLMSLSVVISEGDTQAVISALQEAGKPLSVKELATASGMVNGSGGPNFKFGEVIKEMEQQGTIICDKGKRRHKISLATVAAE